MSFKRKPNLSATIALLPTWFVAVVVFIGTMAWSIRLS
ncbi:sugar ABC transporter permease, partial [Pseudomonas sp. BGM005]|nr:sugar ABC transporter permease [Pseudomonas sp. BG5]